MKQFGNLAIICAQRPDVTLLMQKGQVRVVAYHRGGYVTLLSAWDDEERIGEIIRELNFGRFARNPS